MHEKEPSYVVRLSLKSVIYFKHVKYLITVIYIVLNRPPCMASLWYAAALYRIMMSTDFFFISWMSFINPDPLMRIKWNSLVFRGLKTLKIMLWNHAVVNWLDFLYKSVKEPIKIGHKLFMRMKNIQLNWSYQFWSTAQ